MATHSTLNARGTVARGITSAMAALALLAILIGWSSARLRAQPAPPPQRIITVIPAVTEILFAVGAGSQLVGIGSFDRLPSGAAEIARVGGLVDPDMEQIFALRPDLVILYVSQSGPREQLQRAGIPVLSYSHAGLDDIAATIRRLGQRTGHGATAATVARRLEEGLDAIRARVAGRPRPRTLLVFSREPLSLRNTYASGGVGFLHDMLHVAGGDNVFGSVVGERVAQVSTEAILTAAPDVIIEIRNGGALGPETVENERAVWQGLPAVPAVARDEIHFLMGGEFVVPGPRVLDAVEQLARLLHPAVF